MAACGEMPIEVVRGSDGEDLGRTRLSLNRDRNALIEVSVATDFEKLPIVAEANAKDFPLCARERLLSASSPRRSSRLVFELSNAL